MINQTWWEHLTPKAMHRLRIELDALLQQWCSTDYGIFWLQSAMNPVGLIRVKPGQRPPFFHVAALKGRTPFILPIAHVREGHRGTGQDHELESGRPFEHGEIALRPQIRLDVVTDPGMIEDVQAMRVGRGPEKVAKPVVMFSASAHMLLNPTGWPKKSFVLYQHIFGSGGTYPDDGYFYVGVTTRSWQKRWSEHRRAMEGGSPLLFHRTMREQLAARQVTYFHHKVMGLTPDLEALYGAEERLVAEHWQDERRLNMIPGGKSGLRYLREHGLLKERAPPLPEDRDRVVADWLVGNPRRGLPAPWVSERWKDDDWAVAQICGREGRLSVEQVRAIRALATQHSADEIAERIGALSPGQVERVICGRTYGRVA